MKDKHSQKELQRLIIRLLRRIAEVNTLPPESRKAENIITVKDKKLGDVEYRIHSIEKKVGVKPSSWFLLERDRELRDEIIAELCDLKPNMISTRKATQMLDDFVWKYNLRGWRLSGIMKDAAALIESIDQIKVETRKRLFPVWGLILEVSPFVIGNVEFRPRTEYPEIDKDLSELKSIDRDSPLFKIHTVAATKSSGGDDYMILQNAEAEVNRALNILRAFLYPIVTDLPLKQVGIMGTFGPAFYVYYYELEKNHLNTGQLPKYFPGGGWSGIGDIRINEYLTESVLPEKGFHVLNSFLTSRPSVIGTKSRKSCRVAWRSNKT